MTRAVPILVLLCVLAFVVILAGCGGTGAPDGATMDTAKKPTPPASTPCRLLCSKRISLEPLASDSFTMYSNGTDVQMLNVGSSGPGDWAPSGQRVVLFRDGLLYTARPDGTDLTPFTDRGRAKVAAGDPEAQVAPIFEAGNVVGRGSAHARACCGQRQAQGHDRADQGRSASFIGGAGRSRESRARRRPASARARPAAGRTSRRRG